MKSLAEGNQFLTYKGYPLVRKGNTLYYGNMYDPFVCVLTIQSTKKVKDLDVADRVKVQLMSTNPSAKPQEIVRKSSEKNGLYAAMDIASIWLQRELKEKS